MPAREMPAQCHVEPGPEPLVLHPLCWWLRAQLRIDQEFMADQKTVVMVGSSAGYATRLVALAAPNDDRAPSLSPMADSVPLLSGWWWDGGFKTPLLQRVVMLLHAPFPIETRASRAWSNVVPPMALITAVLVSSLTLFAVPAATTAASTPSFSQRPRTVSGDQVRGLAPGPSPSGRSPAYILPLPLPGDFELSVEIEASQSTLARMCLAGYPLARSRHRCRPLPAQQDEAIEQPHLALVSGSPARAKGEVEPVRKRPGRPRHTGPRRHLGTGSRSSRHPIRRPSFSNLTVTW